VRGADLISIAVEISSCADEKIGAVKCPSRMLKYSFPSVFESA